MYYRFKKLIIIFFFHSILVEIMLQVNLSFLRRRHLGDAWQVLPLRNEALRMSAWEGG